MLVVFAIIGYLFLLGWVCSRSPGKSIFDREP
jgi:hypothetical protein